eukprot:1077097-Prorocentrum_minimum.AAC.2
MVGPPTREFSKILNCGPPAANNGLATYLIRLRPCTDALLTAPGDLVIILSATRLSRGRITPELTKLWTVQNAAGAVSFAPASVCV